MQVVDNIERQKFENNLSVLMLIVFFGTNGVFGSQKYIDIDLNTLMNRQVLIQFVKKMNIPSNMVDWINETMPNKLVKSYKPSIPLCSWSEVKNDKNIYSQYIKEVIEIYKREIYNLDSKIIDKLLNDIIKKSLSDNDMLSIQEILSCYDIKDEFSISRLFNLETWDKILYPEINKKYQVKNIFGWIKHQPTLEEIYEYLLFVCETNPTLIKSHLRPHAITGNNIKKENKIELVVKALDKIDTETYNYLFFNFIQIDQIYKNEITKLTDKYKIKYYEEVYCPNNPSCANYHLEFEDHWNLYLVDQEKYVEIVSYNTLVIDYAFSHYKGSNFDFLNGFNPNVKQNLINKIIADNDNKHDMDLHYGKIYSLDDLVDINVFIQDPPEFLKSNDLSYYENYSQILQQFLLKIGYDMSKLNYKKYKMNITFDL